MVRKLYEGEGQLTRKVRVIMWVFSDGKNEDINRDPAAEVAESEDEDVRQACEEAEGC